ncbi:MAG: hypothetical protein QNJ30_03965 [Kiloniellales bacterium]|nr:hypothetical protein [Kiloniellales bacterium]
MYTSTSSTLSGACATAVLRHSRRGGGFRAFVLALAISSVAAFGARAEPVVADGNTPFHRIYIVGSGDSAEEDSALTEDLNALRADLEQSQNHKSLNSTSLVRPPLFLVEGAINGAKASALPGDAVTIYLSGRGNVDSFRLTNGVEISATDLADLLDGFEPGVLRTIILDSCFGGSFADDLGGSAEVAVIGTSTTCPFNAPFDDFVQTFSEDIAELAGEGAADSEPDGVVTATELRNGLIGRGWKLGEAGSLDVIENGQSKCDGDCDLPAITVDPPECGDFIGVAGAGFSPFSNVDIDVLDSSLAPQGAGNNATTDAAGAFAAVPVTVPTAPTLVVATDAASLLDWHFCEAGGGMAPDDTAPSCELVAGAGVIDATVQDLESGLAEIRVTRASNVSVSVPSFTVGTTDPVMFQASIVNSRRTARLWLTITDVAGNRTICSKTVRRSR